MNPVTEKQVDVVIAGCGPTGAILAAELRLHDVNVLVLEREADTAPSVRIVGLHIRSLELLAMRGLLDGLLEHGRRRPPAGLFAAISKPVPAGLDSAHAYLLGIRQPVIVRLLEEHAVRLGAHVRKGCTVTDVQQDHQGVSVELADGQRLRARYLIGCDGARSTVRKRLGVSFPGEPARTQTLMGEMHAAAPLQEIADTVKALAQSIRPFWVRPIGEGIYSIVVPAAGIVDSRRAPTIDDFRQQLNALAGTDFGVHSPRWLSRFGDATRLAEQYRVGRVLLAGDAAHIHPPIGGQGLNLGLQDAFNLGWKLAAQVHGWAPPDLLDTYQGERRPIAAAVLDNTRAQQHLSSPDPGAQALRRLFTELMDFNEVNRHLTGMITAIDIRYDFGPDVAHDQVGRRQRDTGTMQGASLYSLMRAGRGLLVDGTGHLHTHAWSERVNQLTDPTVAQAANVPALLLRPDGHIAWIGDNQQDLDEHLARWFGTPANPD